MSKFTTCLDIKVIGAQGRRKQVHGFIFKYKEVA